jgi:hypothetical protein
MTNGMTAETPIEARVDASILFSGDIEMTAGQPIVYGKQVVPNQELSAVGGGAAGGGAGGNAPFWGTDMPSLPPPPAAAAGGGAGGDAPPLLPPPAAAAGGAAGSSSSSSSSNNSRNSRSFCGNLCLRMKKARISQGSIQ